MTTATAPTAPKTKIETSGAIGAYPNKRIFNFSAGPAILPEEVLKQCQQDIWNIFGSGIGIMEHSHRGPVFDRVIDEAKADCRAIASISDDYEVLLREHPRGVRECHGVQRLFFGNQSLRCGRHGLRQPNGKRNDESVIYH